MEPVEDARSERLVAQARAVRGVVAAALVDGAGAIVEADADDPGLLDQMQVTATSALAAAEAFSDLMPEDGPPGLTAIYEDGQPLLFTPLGDDMTLVVAVASAADIGRARFQLKRLSNG